MAKFGLTHRKCMTWVMRWSFLDILLRIFRCWFLEEILLFFQFSKFSGIRSDTQFYNFGPQLRYKNPRVQIDVTTDRAAVPYMTLFFKDGRSATINWRRFFSWVQTSVRLCASESQKVLCKIGLILKLRNVKICSSFLFVNYWKIIIFKSVLRS